MSSKSRRHARYPILAVASISAKNSARSRPLRGLINNISSAGLGLSAYAPLEEGTPVSLDIRKIMGTEDRDRVNGTVAWAVKQKDYYYMGILFDEEILPDSHPYLYRHFFDTVESI